MKNKIYLIFFFMFLLVGIVTAKEVCLDFDDPSAPTGLSTTGNVQLSWNAATDEPECSGIDYYKIYRDDLFLGTTTSTSYIDTDSPLPDGTYNYKVIAVDLAGNEGEPAIGSITLPTPPSGSPGGGGPGGGGPGGAGIPPGEEEELADEETEPSKEKDLGTGSEVKEAGSEKEPEEETQKGLWRRFLDAITGAATGPRKTGYGIGLIVVILAIGLLIYKLVMVIGKKKK